MKKIIAISIVFLVAGLSFTSACTIAVISGKATRNGRPLLWKNRDTHALNNKIMIFHDGKYPYVGLVNSGDKTGKSIWIGYNSKGFAIMNSVSYNLNGDSIKDAGGEGRFMKKALQTCATVADFEKLLHSLPMPTRMESNYGVIDAQGGAAIFEVGNFVINKLDANDPKIAPEGYILHTNYSFTGRYGDGAGFIRYLNTQPVFEQAVRNGGLSPKIILQKAARNLKHSLTGVDLRDYATLPANHPKMVWFKDFVPRITSASSCVVEGVRPGDDPAFTTMWTVLGWPLASVAVPVFLTKKGGLPEILQYDKKRNDAPLCHFALTLKERCFTYNWGHSAPYYMNINALINADKTGILQVLRPLEDSLFSQSDEMIARWEKAGKINPEELRQFYDRTDREVRTYYHQHFGLATAP
jgi:hypothetical protein